MHHLFAVTIDIKNYDIAHMDLTAIVWHKLDDVRHPQSGVHTATAVAQSCQVPVHLEKLLQFLPELTGETYLKLVAGNRVGECAGVIK